MIKPEHIVERQGKSFVLYAGLLAEAHEKGLRSIVTELLQIPSDDNMGVAICRAIVTLKDDSTFTGIGDAATNNVSLFLAKAIIRMAETRAKARALRDAVNIAITALDELADDSHAEQETEETHQQHQVVPGERARVRPKPNQAMPFAQMPAHDQCTLLANLAKKKGQKLIGPNGLLAEWHKLGTYKSPDLVGLTANEREAVRKWLEEK